MPVINTFVSSGPGDWDYTYTDYISGTRYTEITDTIDYHLVQSTNMGLAAYLAHFLPRGSGNILRLKCQISINRLPDLTLDDLPTLFNFLVSNNGTWASSFFYFDLRLTGSGKLQFYYDSDTQAESSSALSTGTTYDLEIVADSSGATPSLRVYVDGDLWLDVDDTYTFFDFPDYAYVGLKEGIEQHGVGNYSGSVNVTLHVGSHSDGQHVFTVEDPTGNGRWTMMALL